jgi:hypothetical protein
LYAILEKPGEMEIVHNPGESRRTRNWYAILAQPEEEEN